MPKKPKCWSHAEGEKGATVTVYERRPGGLLYARAFDPTRRAGKGGYVRRSLKHRDQDRAKTYALEQAAKLRQGQNEVAQAKTTLARLLASYQTHRTPRKSLGDQGEDLRRAAMFTRVFGAQKDPHLISLGEWEAFIEARGCGAIGADGGCHVATGARGNSATARAGRVVCHAYNHHSVGAWRSLVAHLHGVQGAGGSNPLAPTIFLSTGRPHVCPRSIVSLPRLVRLGRWRYVALAAIALSEGRLFPSFDSSGFERAMDAPLRRVVVTGVGHWRGEGLALLEAVGKEG